MSQDNFPLEYARVHGPHEAAGPDANSSACGYRLACGRLVLWSIPLGFLFQPPSRKLTHFVTVNAEIFALAHRDADLAEILSRSVNTIDGRVLQWICRLLYPSRQILQQTGATFILDLAEHCRKNSLRLFLLGSTQHSNALAVQALAVQFPGLQISGYAPTFQNRPFDPAWSAGVLKQIALFCPHYLAVCLGPAKQEFWISENAPALSALGVRCAYGLGGTIDFVAGTKLRAPKWIQFIGLEWLFRLACEPRARFLRTMTMFRMPVLAARTVRKIEAV